MSDALVSLLTPPGKAALATIALTGKRAWNMVSELFTPIRGGALPDHPVRGYFWLGRLGKEMSEEAVLAVLRDDPVLVELHVHGGHEIARYIFDLLESRGAMAVPWTTILAAYQQDALRREAAEALTSASTTRTASILLDQYHGALGSSLRSVESRIIDGDFAGALELLLEVLRYSEVGQHLTTPWRVVIAGAPNAGKSSLLNALAGYQRSVVSPVPGTTRDVVAVRLAVDGWPVEIMDTAGVRSAGESLERMGIDRALAAAARADLVLWLVDASEAPSWPAERTERVRIVVSKIDLPAAWDLAEASAALRTSAATGQGIAELVTSLSSWLVKNPPRDGDPVPFTRKIVERLCEAARVLENAGESERSRILALLHE